MPVTTRFYQTAIDHVYFYEIDFTKLIIRYPRNRKKSKRLKQLTPYQASKKGDSVSETATLSALWGGYLQSPYSVIFLFLQFQNHSVLSNASSHWPYQTLQIPIIPIFPFWVFMDKIRRFK